MTLTKEDLEALARAEAEIRALPSTEPEAVDPFALFKRPARLDQTPEYMSAMVKAAEAEPPTEVRPDCAAPAVRFSTCHGDELRCIPCSLVLTMRRIASLQSPEPCPYGCGKPVHECVQLVGEVAQ